MERDQRRDMWHCRAARGTGAASLEGQEVFDCVLWAGVLPVTPKCCHSRNVNLCCPRSHSLPRPAKGRSSVAVPASVPVSFPVLSCPSSTQARREIPIFPVELGLAPSLTGRAVAIDAAETWFPVPLFLASEVRDLHVETSQKISN